MGIPLSTDAIDREMDPKRALRLALIAHLAGLPDDPTETELGKANRRWKHYRRQVARAFREVGLIQYESGFFERHLAEYVFSHPAWIRFAKMRTKEWHSTPEAKEHRRTYAKEWYASVGKERRQAPEMRERLNAQRRARYAKAKEAQ